MKQVVLAQVLTAASSGQLPQTWAAPDVFERLAADRAWIASLAGCDEEIYGVNRRPGHRDSERVQPRDEVILQRQILESHLVPPLTAECYSAFEVRCIGLAKAKALSLGGVGITPELYRHLLDALTDDAFRPAVPSGQSYSSGDVIPAAHWACALLDWREYAKRAGIAPGEAMALINGNFVHAGLAMSALPALRKCGVLLAHAFGAIAIASQAPPATFARSDLASDAPVAPLLEHVIRAVEYSGHVKAPAVQVPVSVRGIPEVLAGYSDAITWLAERVEQVLSAQSGNPLFDAQRQLVRSQGSFLAPAISLAQSAALESMLLAAWALVAQMQYLLSGEVPGLRVDAATSHDPLGLIQVPKAMMATLEDLRLRCGRRTFAAGAATSHGVEDLWTHGEALSRQVAFLADAVSALAARAWAVCEMLVPAPGAGDEQPAPTPARIMPSRAMRTLQDTEARLRASASELAFMDWVPAATVRAADVN